MRAVVLALLGACQFTPHALDQTGDAAPSDHDGGPTDDGSSTLTGHVRMIDLVDAKVVGGPHAGFPLLVSLTDSWLRDMSDGGDVARADGFDIYFSADQAGDTRLAHEVEQYDPVAGSLVAWVQIPSLTPQSMLYLHYGDTTITTSQENRAGVWGTSYHLVLHMAGGGDATADNAPTTASVTAVTGQIGPAGSFDASTSDVGAGSLAPVDDIFAAAGTLEGWFYANSFGEGGFGRLFDKGFHSGYALYLDNTNRPNTITLLHECTGGIGDGAWAMASLGTILQHWHHFAVVYDSSSTSNTPTVYLDGAPVAITDLDTPGGSMISDASQDLHVGNDSTGARTFDGVLDEMRMSSVARDASWIATQYANQSDPASFYTLGAPL